MLQELLSTEVQSFIRAHENEDERNLLLKHKLIHGIPAALIADQIRGRKKSKEKLPSYYNAENILYPPGINLEQCSSEKTAQFKIDFLQKNIGVPTVNVCADLTGGFGVDSFFFSKIAKTVHYVEPNLALQLLTRHNHEQFGRLNIEYHNTTAEEFLISSTHLFDFVYIDPSRRAEGNKKVFRLSDTEPDVTALLKSIFENTSVLLIKASPLLDIHSALKQLSFVKTVIVLSVENECKELLFYCEKDFNDEPVIEAVNLRLGKTDEPFFFSLHDEENARVELAEPLTYLYEPNASILKAGAFKLVGENFSLAKIHPSTHLYTASSLIPNFPGRTYRIVALVKPDDKMLKAFFPEGKANITTRNYPLSVRDLKRKTKLKDGGYQYLIGFTGIKKKYLAVAERLA